MSRAAPSGVLAVVLGVGGCLGASQEHAEVRLRIAGAPVTGPFPTTRDWSVELERADLAFGPLYLCAGYRAGALCDTARLEWLDSVVVDGLDPGHRDAGVLLGTSGSVRSWMYDLGIVSLLTQQTPRALSAAEELGGNSVVLAGSARKNAHTIGFSLELPIAQTAEPGVPVIRKSTRDPFAEDVTGGETLTVGFDPRQWVRDVDFDALVEDAVCAPAGPRTVCAGTIELTCADTGATESERNCAELDAACIRGVGCTGHLRFGAESQGYRAVVASLVAGEPPSFDWATSE
jgi:hypothetical protein